MNAIKDNKKWEEYLKCKYSNKSKHFKSITDNAEIKRLNKQIENLKSEASKSAVKCNEAILKKFESTSMSDINTKELTGFDLNLYIEYREWLKKCEYRLYLFTPYWKVVRESIIKRDNYKCTICGNKSSLRVHHLTYAHRGEELNYPQDLITVCESCHKKLHNNKVF